MALRGRICVERVMFKIFHFSLSLNSVFGLWMSLIALSSDPALAIVSGKSKVTSGVESEDNTFDQVETKGKGPIYSTTNELTSVRNVGGFAVANQFLLSFTEKDRKKQYLLAGTSLSVTANTARHKFSLGLSLAMSDGYASILDALDALTGENRTSEIVVNNLEQKLARKSADLSFGDEYVISGRERLTSEYSVGSSTQKQSFDQTGVTALYGRLRHALTIACSPQRSIVPEFSISGLKSTEKPAAIDGPATTSVMTSSEKRSQIALEDIVSPRIKNQYRLFVFENKFSDRDSFHGYGAGYSLYHAISMRDTLALDLSAQNEIHALAPLINYFGTLNFERRLDASSSAAFMVGVRENSLLDVYKSANNEGWQGIRTATTVYESSVTVNYLKMLYASNTTFRWSDFRNQSGRTLTLQKQASETLTLLPNAPLSYIAFYQVYANDQFQEEAPGRLTGNVASFTVNYTISNNKQRNTKLVGGVGYAHASQRINWGEGKNSQDLLSLFVKYDY